MLLRRNPRSQALLGNAGRRSSASRPVEEPDAKQKLSHPCVPKRSLGTRVFPFPFRRMSLSPDPARGARPWQPGESRVHHRGEQGDRPGDRPRARRAGHRRRARQPRRGEGPRRRRRSSEAEGIKSVEAVRFDVTRPEDHREIARHLEDRYGKLDILVNNAGVMLEDGRLRRRRRVQHDAHGDAGDPPAGRSRRTSSRSSP